jgi:hypothetical protein
MCQNLRFEDGKKFNFRRKRHEHVATEIMLPDGAPDWAADPKILWSKAENAEARGDAQTARTVMISIPRSIPENHRMEFTKAIVKPWIKDGMTAQIDLHNTKDVDGLEQPHAHILLTLRRFDGDSFAKTKERQWNRDFNEDKSRAMRRAIADRMNQYLADLGLDVRADARTHAEQGVHGAQPPEQNVSKSEWEAYKKNQDDPAARRVRKTLADRAGRQRGLATAHTSATPPATHQDKKPLHGQPEPWMLYQGGPDALPPRLMESARRSYQIWARDNPKPAAAYGFSGYVSYAQTKFAARTASGTVSPRDRRQAEERREKFLRQLLSDHYDVPDQLLEHVRWMKPNPNDGMVTLHLHSGGRIIDNGDHLEWSNRDHISAADANVIAAAVAAHGWQGAALGGSKQFRDAVAAALALRQPPIRTDHRMSPQVQILVDQEIRKRQEAEIAKKNAEAKARIDRQAQAIRDARRRAVEAARLAAQAARAGQIDSGLTPSLAPRPALRPRPPRRP